MVKTALALLCFGVGAGVLMKNYDYKHLLQRGMRDGKELHLSRYGLDFK
jgi:hypothetical protein